MDKNTNNLEIMPVKMYPILRQRQVVEVIVVEVIWMTVVWVKAPNEDVCVNF